MLRASVTPTKFYESEIAVPLRFTITDLDGNAVDTTYNTYSLIVADNDNSPFALTPVEGEEGVVEYVTEDGDFETGGDPTKRFSCYIVQDADYPYGEEVWFTDEFPIYVMFAPSENL